MPCVHHADAHLLSGHQDGGDVTPGQGEDEADAVSLQHLGHQLPAMTGTFGFHLLGYFFGGGDEEGLENEGWFEMEGWGSFLCPTWWKSW